MFHFLPDSVFNLPHTSSSLHTYTHSLLGYLGYPSPALKTHPGYHWKRFLLTQAGLDVSSGLLSSSSIRSSPFYYIIFIICFSIQARSTLSPGLPFICLSASRPQRCPEQWWGGNVWSGDFYSISSHDKDRDPETKWFSGLNMRNSHSSETLAWVCAGLGIIQLSDSSHIVCQEAENQTNTHLANGQVTMDILPTLSWLF